MRNPEDERVLLIELTPEGEALREPAAEIPGKLAGCMRLTPEEGMELYRLLYKLLESD